MTESIDRALSWDDEITKESEFILLQPGEYDFKVDNVEKSYFNGSANMSPCPQAIVHLTVNNEATIKVNLFLNTKSEWKLSEFFTSIGLKKKGEPLKMNWNAVPGKTGICAVKNREYNGQKYNEVAKFLEPEPQKNSWGAF